MTQPDEYWNHSAKEHLKLSKTTALQKFYDSEVIKESKTFINYGN